jgi:hypothetical protein
MKKIVMVGISIFLLSACGGGGSSSPKKGPLSSQNPMDRVIGGGDIPFQRYTLTNTPDAKLPWCSIAKGFLIIKNNIVSGTMIHVPKPYVIFGTYIPETGNINGGFAEAEQSIAQYRGTINLSKGNGTWSDDFGCSGVWEAIVEK